MPFGKSVALAFSLMILGQAYLVRRVVGTWLFPACLFGLFWFGYTFIPLAILFWVPVQPYATAFIFVCTVAFSFGSLPFDWRAAFQKNTEKRETVAQVYGSSFLRATFYQVTFASLIFLVLDLYVQGFSLRDLVSDFFASAAAYSEMRYSESIVMKIFSQLTTVCAFVGAILGGFVFSSMPRKAGRRLVVVLSFLPSVLVAVAQSAKGLLFICIAFFYAATLVYDASMGVLRLFRKGSVKHLAFYGAILAVVVVVSFLSRGLYKESDNDILMSNVGSYLVWYSCGHVYAFSDWFAFTIGGRSELTYPHESVAPGFYTFMPLVRLIGSRKAVPLGVFDEYYSYGDGVGGNIYTMFRGLIQDFGFIGSVLFALAAGLLLHWNFQVMLRDRSPVFTVAVFVLMVAYFYNSYIVSLLMYNGVFLTFGLLWVGLYINKRIVQNGARFPASLPQPANVVFPLGKQPSRP